MHNLLRMIHVLSNFCYLVCTIINDLKIDRKLRAIFVDFSEDSPQRCYLHFDPNNMVNKYISFSKFKCNLFYFQIEP